MHTTLFLTVALETHEMLIRADSALTNLGGTIQLFNKCCLLPKSEKNRGKKKKKNKQLLTYMLAINLDAVTVPGCM